LNGVDIPINFNFNDTHVQNIRTATAMAMSNPSAQNVDTLFNLLKDLMDSNNNTSFLNGHQAVEQKHFVLPVSKVTQPHQQRIMLCIRNCFIALISFDFNSSRELQ
jgi:hypothetical protein